MARVLLVSTNRVTFPYPVYPLGVSTLATALRAAGHEVELLDLLAAGIDAGRLDKAAAAAARCQPDVIGVSIRNIDDADSTSDGGLWTPRFNRDLIAALRRACAAPIVIGGPAVTIAPEAMLAFTGADYAIRGEGEAALPQLLDELAETGGGPVEPRLRGGVETLLAGEAIAPCERDAALGDYYTARSGIANIQTKRGCIYRCGYCTYPQVEGARFRLRDPGEVAEEFERIAREQNPELVFITDSIFNDPDGHWLAVVEQLIRHGNRLKWAAYFNPLNLDDAALAAARRAGLWAVELGTDCGCDATLAALRKPFTWSQVEKVQALMTAHEVRCAHFIMFGGPGETPETVERSLANIARLDHCVVFGFTGLRIYPGTLLAERGVADGVIAPDATLFEPTYYFSPGVDRAWLNARVEAAWHSRRDRVFPPQAGKREVEMLAAMGWRGLLWDRLIRFPRSRKERAR